MQTEKIYVVIGITEKVGQNTVGGPFESDFISKPIKAFKLIESAQLWREKQKLVKPRKDTYSGTSYYKGGYYDLEIEEVDFYL